MHMIKGSISAYVCFSQGIVNQSGVIKKLINLAPTGALVMLNEIATPFWAQTCLRANFSIADLI